MLKKPDIKEHKHHSDSLIRNVLINRGIKDIDLFMEPTAEDNISFDNYKNMDFAVKNTIYHLTKSSKILIIVDPDADGFTSSSMLYQVLLDIKENYNSQSELDIFIQPDKQHGLTESVMDYIMESQPDLLLVPDAGSNDIDELLMLSTSGYNTIVIDHHELEKEELIDLIENTTIINNQRRNENTKVNKHLTGVGMVYKFVEGLYHYLNSSETKLKDIESYLDLFAIGQIGDASDISDNEIRYNMFKGLNNVNNSLLNSTLKIKNISRNGLTPQDMSFSIIPMINATTRIGNKNERYSLFKGLTIDKNKDDLVIKNKRKLNKETRKYEYIDFEIPISESIAEDIIKVKTRQDALVKKEIAKLDGSIDTNQPILVYKTDKIEDGSITGLVAMKLSKKYEKPCFVLLHDKDKNIWSGSARGIDNILDSFKDWCNDTKLFNYAQGHAQAFGVEITDDNLNKLGELIKVSDIKKSDTILVDKKYENDISCNDVNLAIDYKKIIGGKVSPILLGFENIKINRTDIIIKKTMIEFKIGSVHFVMWGVPDEIKSLLEVGFSELLNLTMVGEPFETNFSGKSSNKVVIKELFIDDVDEGDFIF